MTVQSGKNIGLQLADSLQMTLMSTNKKGFTSRVPYEIEGETTRTLEIHGQKLILHPFIVDSMGFSGLLLHVMAHIAGDLFLSMTSDSRDKKVTAILVDGSLCDLGEVDNSDILYPSKKWSRYNLYEAISAGVVAVFQRDFNTSIWNDLGTEWVLDYLLLRDKQSADKFIRTENKRTETKV